jgi:cysteine desulfurase family protein (TIGR01976 family)
MPIESNAPAVLSTDDIRQQFPAVLREHAGRPVAYFDGPGGTQVPRPVVEAVGEYLLHHNANTHWAFPTSVETDAALTDARHALGDFLNASPNEISFGANMTTITFHVARALGRTWGPDDEVVVTDLDHHANRAPWQALAHERGIQVRSVRLVPQSGELDWGDLERHISTRTRVVAIGAASNALGTVNDVARAARLAHDAGALLFVDGVHYAAHLPVDVQALECDFFACSAYKFYGPHVGVLYGRRDLLASLDVPKLQPAPDTVPERVETGTQNHEGIVGAAAAVDFLAGLASGARSQRAALEAALTELHARGQLLLTRLYHGLAALSGVTVYGPTPDAPRTPTLSFTLTNRACEEVARELADRALFVSHGNFYAATVAERLGRHEDGFVRAGCACYTTIEEVERLIDAVQELAE